MQTLLQDHPSKRAIVIGGSVGSLRARGREVLEQLFPGFTEEVVAQGANTGDIVDKILWFSHGFHFCNAPGKMLGLEFASSKQTNS